MTRVHGSVIFILLGIVTNCEEVKIALDALFGHGFRFESVLRCLFVMFFYTYFFIVVIIIA